MIFNAEQVKRDVVQWIRDWFKKNGDGCRAIVGISGGKDSSVVAALCAEALGKERVLGVLMPNGVQSDIDVAEQLVMYLEIPHVVINIRSAYDALLEQLQGQLPTVLPATTCNMPARLRMTSLYAVAQSMNGRVANTCNLSEDWVGYSTLFGDAAGDFSPLAKLTVQEVKQLGRTLGLPSKFVEKVPIDGLSGKTDEENLGFTYEVLDRYIRTGLCENEQTRHRIDELHVRNQFKLEPMPMFPYQP